jgi:lysophospholipase L1-like esterase
LFFYLVIWTFPFAMLASLEGAAIAFRLADRVAVVEDLSVIRRRAAWTTSDTQWPTPSNGFRLYRPTTTDDVVINDLGLRTALPTPKAPNEWRIAVTGGSVAWGHRLVDLDTIPVRLQQNLLRNARVKTSVYNFGIEGATISAELALLKQFKDVYSIDQVVFLTGGNDVYIEYFADQPPLLESNEFWKAFATFELVRSIERIGSIWIAPSNERLARLDRQLLPRAAQDTGLRRGIIAAAEYCRAGRIECDFVLHPPVFARNPPVGSEVQIAQSLKRAYPRLDVLTSQMYRDAITNGPAGRVHDLSDIFDRSSQQVFTDSFHLNEIGNELVAKRLAAIVAAGLQR